MRVRVAIVVALIGLAALGLLLLRDGAAPARGPTRVAVTSEAALAPVVTLEPPSGRDLAPPAPDASTTPPAPTLAPALVRGRVVDTDGRPVAGAAVSLLDLAAARGDEEVEVTPEARALVAELEGRHAPRVVASSTSGEDGAFTLTRVEGAGVAVTARLRLGGALRAGAVRLDPGRLDAGDVMLWSTIHEVVVEVRAHGRPLPDARVRALRQVGRAHEALSSLRTDGRGEARLELGAHDVRAVASVAAPGLATALVTLAWGDEPPAPRTTVALAPEALVEGRVVDERGVALADVEVSGWTEAADPRTGEHPDAVARCRSDAEGRFTLRGLGEGEASLEAQPPPDRLEASAVVTAPARDVTLVLSPAAKLAVTFRLSESARRRFEAGFWSSRAPGELVRLVPVPPERPWRGGRAEWIVEDRALFERVPPGRYRIVGELHGHLQPEPCPEVELRAGEAPTVEVVLSLGRTITGRVVDRTGRPVVDEGIGCGHLGGQVSWLSSERTDAQGRFTLEHAPYVAYALHLPSDVVVDVPEGLHDLTLPDIVVDR